jgi:peptidoglycan/LPS O-acetylase OafA/YrhL
MTSPRRRALQLPTTGASKRRVFRRRRRPARWRQAGVALLLGAAGAGLLLALLQLPERFDTFLLLSTALANLIGGVQQALWGLVQLLAVVMLVLAAIAALGLVLAGVIRLVRALWPQPSSSN